MCDYFATFCWLWNFLLENLKLKKYSDDVHWTNMKTFQITRFWFIYILAQILFFGGTALGRFFYFSSLANHGDRHFYLVHPPSPHHKKASYGPVIIMEIFSIGWISYAVLSNSFRSSRPEVFYKKSSQSFAKLTGNQSPLPESLFDQISSSCWNTKK